MINLKNLIVNGIMRLGHMLYGNDAEFKGLLNCGGLKVGSNTNTELQPCYFQNGLLQTCDKGVVDAETFTSGSGPTAASYIGTATASQAGSSSVIDINGGVTLTTTSTRGMSSSKIMDLYLRNNSVSGSDTVLLTDKNWSQYIDLDEEIEAGNGLVTVTHNGSTLGSFTVNQTSNTTINVPPLISTPSAGITSAWTSAFRTQTRGNSSNTSYLSIQRSEASGIAGAPQYGSYLAGGYGNTQFVITANPNSREAYFGGGDGEALHWKKRIAFKEDLPNVTNYMYGNATNSNKNAIHNIASKGVLAWDNTALNDRQEIYVNGDGRHTMQAFWECMTEMRASIFQSTIGYLPKTEMSNLWYKNDPTRYNRFWNVVESTSQTNKNKVYDAYYHGNIQYCTPYIDLSQFRGNVQLHPSNNARSIAVRIDLWTPTQASVLTTDSLNYIFIKPYFLNATTELVKKASINVVVPPNTQWYLFIDDNNLTAAGVTTTIYNKSSYPKMYGISMDPSQFSLNEYLF